MKHEAERKFNYKGLKCRIIDIEGKYRCGYVGVPLDHIAAIVGKYNEIPCDIHGGLTYASREGDDFYVGFDCAHLGDTREIWTLEAVTEEVKKLVEQMNNLTWDKVMKYNLQYMPEWFNDWVKIVSVNKQKRRRSDEA